MKKLAVIIYGPPGSGKGTQAELLARKHGFIHFDTGRYVEQLVHDPVNKNNPVIQRERKLFDTGMLMTPSFVLREVSRATKQIARAGFGIAYSSSPRTWFEAFGKNREERGIRRGKTQKIKKYGLVAVLEKFYGKHNIKVIKLNVKSGTSLKRNSARVVCSVCGLPVLAAAKNKTCSFCAGPPRKRTLDDPKVIEVRLREYRKRTYPILAELKRRGFWVKEINGEPPPYKVFASIERALKL